MPTTTDEDDNTYLQLTKNDELQRKVDRQVKNADFIFKYNCVKQPWILTDPKMSPEQVDDILEEIANNVGRDA